MMSLLYQLQQHTPTSCCLLQFLLDLPCPAGLMPWVNSTSMSTCTCGQQTLFELQQQFSRTFKDALAACIALAVLLLSGKRRTLRWPAHVNVWLLVRACCGAVPSSCDGQRTPPVCFTHAKMASVCVAAG
jgi:hypothetical protein